MKNGIVKMNGKMKVMKMSEKARGKGNVKEEWEDERDEEEEKERGRENVKAEKGCKEDEWEVREKEQPFHFFFQRGGGNKRNKRRRNINLF